MMDDENFNVSVDGTPMRVVALALSAAASLAALRWAGFRFNVGVSS
jgi:ABC-type Fe3+-citrate transport system substrate-binding protein